jgi:hypothetical protein
MQKELLDNIPLWGILAWIIALLCMGLEGGFRFAQWRNQRAPDEREQVAGVIVASILGLVALVLGFTFSLAAQRFDARRLGVLEESNAIGTTWLRTRFLPEPQQSQSDRLLREYVELRVRVIQEGQIESALARSNELHSQLWSQAVQARQHSDSISTGLYIQSLNQMIDLHATRLLAARSRIPLALWIALYFLAALGIAAVGYQSGLAAGQRSLAAIALIIAFICVLYLIADLDRSQEGLFRVSQQPMLDLLESMKEQKPQSAP